MYVLLLQLFLFPFLRNIFFHPFTFFIFYFFIFILKIFLIDYAITVFPIFSPLSPLCPACPHPSASPFQSTSPHPWVVYISSLSLLFPIPFFILPVYLMPTNHAASSLYLFPPIPPLPLPTEIPPCDVHFTYSFPVLVGCLVFVSIVFLFF